MKAALIHYDVTRNANEAFDATVMRHVGHMPSIQLLYVAAVLERAGVEVLFIDPVAMDLDGPALAERLARFDPDLVGLSVFTFHFHNAISWVSRIRALLPRARVILGGVHVGLYPVETLRHIPGADFACTGEAEMVLPEFIGRWNAGRGYEGLRGLVWRDGDEIRYAGPAGLCRDLDSVPFPARHLIPNHRYYNFISSRRNYTVLISSRGCPFQCIFCEAQRSNWRGRSAGNVVAEFAECHNRHGVREIDVFDICFTADRRRVMDICRMLVERGLNRDLVWDIRSRVDTIDSEMLAVLRKAGCRRIFYGLESGNPGILGTLCKKADLALMESVVRMTNAAGIGAFGHFLVGAPGETPETARQTVEFARRLPLEFAAFHGLVAFPATELYEKHYMPATGRDYWAEYIASPEPPREPMGRPWTAMTDSEVRRTARRAMIRFYFRPRQIMRILRSVKSWSQLWRYAAAAWDMLWTRPA